MPTLNIEGRKIKVDDAFLSMSPEEQNKAVEEIAGELGVSAPPAAAPAAKTGRVEAKDEGSVGRSVDSFGRGAADIMSFGLADEISGLGNAVVKSLNPFKDYSKDFPSVSAEIQKERDIQKFRDKNDPVSSTVGRVAGGLTQGIGMARAGLSLTANAPASAGLLAKMGRGAAEGAAYGAAYGAGSGEGVTDRAASAVGGGVAGGLIGGAVPAVVEGVKAVSIPIRDAVMARTNPGGYASQKITERLANSNLTADQAANRMDDTGLSLADVGGKSTRDLLRTTTNIPGPAKDRVNKMLTLRQFGQGDRIKDVVKDVFADPDGFITAGEKLSKQWSAVGDEVYAPALAKKVVWTDRLKQFVDEPVFQKGLAQGVKIQRLESLAEGKPFNPLDYAITGFNEAGDPILGGVPNMRTLNVAKKGLDVMISEARHPLTGKLTEEGRALDMVRRSYLSTIDSWNPDYKQARGVWGGFAKVKEAMLFGQNDALGMSPEAVAKSFKEMSTSEQQAARIGIADALRKKIDGSGYTHNAVLKIFGSRQSLGVLRAAFPDQKTFAAFRKEMFNEARKRATYEAVKGNSTTASQMADMFETGGMQEGFNAAKTAATQGVIPAALQWVGSRLKMLGGLTPEVADQISRRLMTTNPQNVQRITQELAQLERANLTAAQRSNALNGILTRALQAPAQSSALQPQ